MDLNSDISNLFFYIEEDICYIKGNDNFVLSFNINQITKIDNDLNILKIHIDLDLIIIVNK